MTEQDETIKIVNKTSTKRLKKQQISLQKYYNDDINVLEIGIDEAGRGPMFGRVYSGAVILPKDDSFDHSLMKDSKRFHSKKKIQEAAEYIKKNAISWSVGYSDEKTIDKINIRIATHQAMHQAVRDIICSNNSNNRYHLLVDGNDFTPFMKFDDVIGLVQTPHICIEGGDNKYTAIAAASILAKVERDAYIAELCRVDPTLDERYGLLSNNGYGTKIHMDGIKTYGISKYHRKTFGICQNYNC
jgi:ribonuclease HII